ncbi:hypothetical protein L198_05917 [Cryptococcus wingfieldii CBS 7118]|uniref:Uncharacterized protein n=1 Tax=Cryptococcus wingfieldii CBS 7118 TaxID=1295528 RepID=A0A1E3IS03_9TREE|nr:hypothetical protein L198_05917 [Cryptococcus wingfieldii CBS 7118]ODN91403.1 hypothetical protein L198_05917 [Cryptococcus wingfieldii CBS 7118]
MAQDRKGPLGPPPALEDDFDLPPSYDSSLATAAAPGASSSTAPSGDGHRAVPDHIRFFFTPPVNSEPVSSDERRDATARQRFANVQMVKKGNRIETWDPILSNPNTLYDFIRYMASVPPKVNVRCRGWHMETCERETIIDGRTVRRGEQTSVIDFDFTIDLTDIIDHSENSAQVHLSTALPWQPAHRGTNSQTYSAAFHPPSRHNHHGRSREDEQYISLAENEDANTTLPGRSLGHREEKQDVEWQTWRTGKGLPVWVDRRDVPEYEEYLKNKGKGKGRGSGSVRLENDSEQPLLDEELSIEGTSISPTQGQGQGHARANLKEWCKAYCADRGVLNEFSLQKDLCGWDLDGVQSAINGAIRSTGYSHPNLEVTLDVDDRVVIVHPNNFLSRILGNSFVYFLSWLFMIYPLIWFWKRWSSRGGAPWDVTVATYALKFYPPLPHTFPSEPLPDAQSRLPSLYKLNPQLPKEPQLVQGPKGVHYLVGRKEGGWFREWEERIRMGVRTRFRGELVGGTVGEDQRVELDGY